jgi:MmyB-like transcription regulator ligand binding domain
LYEGVAADLLEPPLNAMRLSLHPQGLAPRIVNLAEWRAHLLYRLRRQVELTADRALIDLLHEVSGYPAAADRCGKTPNVEQEIAVPFRIRTSVGVLSFFSMTTVFGTPVDVMLSELALELFFPADDDTAAAVHRLAADARSAN